MATFNIDLSDFVEVINEVDVVVRVEKWTEEQAQHMVPSLVAQGLRIILQRAPAGQKDSTKAIKDKAIALEKGDYSFGGGGAGKPRLTLDTRAEREFLVNYFEQVVKENKTVAVKSAAAKDAWDRVTRRLLIEEANANGADPKEINFATEIPNRRDEAKEFYAEEIEMIRADFEAQEKMEAARKEKLAGLKGKKFGQ